MIGPRGDNRAVSISVTHVLTIGITTILISMLLIGGSSVLEAETDRSVEGSLETVGERFAGEIDNADRIAANDEDAKVAITAEHPRTVSNRGYTIAALRDDDCGDEAPLLDGSTDCLRLTAQDVDVVVYVPLAESVDVDEGSVSGGTIEIKYDGEESDKITLEEAN